MRACRNWQTSKTKDLVCLACMGSSPIVRTMKNHFCQIGKSGFLHYCPFSHGTDILSGGNAAHIEKKINLRKREPHKGAALSSYKKSRTVKTLLPSVLFFCNGNNLPQKPRLPEKRSFFTFRENRSASFGWAFRRVRKEGLSFRRS